LAADDGDPSTGPWRLAQCPGDHTDGLTGAPPPPQVFFHRVRHSRPTHPSHDPPIHGCELPPLLTGADQLTGEPLGVPAAGPDTVAFLVQAGDAPPVPLAEMDGRYVSTEVATGYTGRVAGMYVTEGTAHFDWFDYTTGDDRDTA
jgi:hypothetical protein